jgi:penicillin-insensitive murein endopeptidase
MGLIPFLVLGALALGGIKALVGHDHNPWGQVKAPSVGAMGPIGGYSAGCIDGASLMPDTGHGYQVMRLSRNRFYGHPQLLQFVDGFTSSVRDARIGTLLIGDMSQPRGGPMPSGHASHQIGLDVDIWFWLNPEASTRKLTADEREKLSAPAVVDPDTYEMIRVGGPGAPDNGGWRPQHVEVLKLASERPEVERVFVNPGIKRELCQTLPPENHGWLQKLRPWWGHHDHFHVRLKCPTGATYCKSQDPVAVGDGCGADLDWWFQKENRFPPIGTKEVTPPSPALPSLPAQCGEVLKKM